MDVSKIEPLMEAAVTNTVSFVKENPAAVVGASVSAVLAGLLLASRRKTLRDGSDFTSISGSLKFLNNEETTMTKEQVASEVSGYEKLFKGARQSVGQITTEESVETRKTEYQTMVNSFYNLVTDFYEWGWGQSFHFAPRWTNETFMESIYRAEYHLANNLGLRPGHHVLDVGCGVGGPMRNIARFSGCSVTGITINQYQVDVGNRYCRSMGLADRCQLVQGDFQTLPFGDQSFDAAWQIEATCHSPDRVRVFSEVLRTLKPGGVFAGYEWVVLPNYDEANADHVRIKEGIEVGNGLPTLVRGEDITACLEAAGFEVVTAYDAQRGVHSEHEIPWYATLQGTYSISGFRMTYLGRCCTHALVWTLETVGLAPRGTTRVSALLNATALDLVEGGQLEIFTPSWFFVARRPSA